MYLYYCCVCVFGRLYLYLGLIFSFTKLELFVTDCYGPPSAYKGTFPIELLVSFDVLISNLSLTLLYLRKDVDNNNCFIKNFFLADGEDQNGRKEEI
jgi:hypothetical protein